jgi:hypothetical protein
MVAGQRQPRRHATAAEIEGGAKGETEGNEENWQTTALSKGRAGQDRAERDRVGGFAGSESAVMVR